MKREYIDALTHAYTSICQCGHAADLHAHHNGHDHPGDTALGVCGCVLSVQEAALIAQAGTIAQQRQTIDALVQALKPFAAGGNLFTANDEFDTSQYVIEPDSAPIGNRHCWDYVPLTIGDLRRAYNSLVKARGDIENANKT